MALSVEQMERLETQYEIWGLDLVRRELERDDRDRYASPDVTAFARAWIEAKEARHRRKRLLVLVLATFGIVLISAVRFGILEF